MEENKQNLETESHELQTLLSTFPVAKSRHLAPSDIPVFFIFFFFAVLPALTLRVYEFFSGSAHKIHVTILSTAYRSGSNPLKSSTLLKLPSTLKSSSSLDPCNLLKCYLHRQPFASRQHFPSHQVFSKSSTLPKT